MYQDALNDARLRQVTHPFYTRQRGRFLLAENVLQYVIDKEHQDEQGRRTLINAIFNTHDVMELVPAFRKASTADETQAGPLGETDIEDMIKMTINNGEYMDDSVFLPRLSALVDLEPLLAAPAAEMLAQAVDHLRNAMVEKVGYILTCAKVAQQGSLRKTLEQEFARAHSEAVRSAQDEFVASISEKFVSNVWYVCGLSVNHGSRL
jgi:hypothetical protein